MKDIVLDRLSKYYRNEYQRDNFDSFLKAIKFSYNIPSIHIGGTNGKGSTAIFISNILIDAGYKVGLFTSPYFYRVNEQTKINNKSIPDAYYLSILDKYEKQFKKYDLSSFEIEVFVSLNYFISERVDIAVIECGMGGEDDATNIFNPLISIITSISLEHTDFLGKSVAEIAFNKAGIIKPRVPVIISDIVEEAKEVIKKVAKENKSDLISIRDAINIELKDEGYIFTYSPIENLYIPVKSLYLIKDASLAIEAIQLLSNFNISEDNIRNGIKNFFNPGRMEIVNSNPLVIVDGAHNPEGIKELIKSMEKIEDGRHIKIIFACFKDKNIALMLDDLSVLSSDITLTTFDHYRARKEEDYFLYLEEYKFVEDYKSLIESSLNNEEDQIILITGSLAFASKARQLFEVKEYE